MKPLAARYQNIPLNERIKYRGRDQQELQYLFPTLYGHTAVTRATKGNYKQFDRVLSKYTKRQRVINSINL